MGDRDDDADVTIAVASRNTRRATELAIRSLRATTSAAIWVGDCASSDGSLEVLRALQREGVIQHLDEVEDRSHGQWVDHWRATAPTPLLAVADSDIEVHDPAWLARMRDALRTQRVGLVSVGAHAAGVHIEPNTFAMRTVPRPEMYLLLLDVEATRSCTASFDFALAQDGDDWVAWDTGARFAAELDERGIGWGTMPAAFAESVTHWGALSYMTDDRRLPVGWWPRARVRVRRARVEARVARHLRRARRRVGARDSRL